MNEQLVHDLTSALQESELKIEVDEDLVDKCSNVSIHRRIKRLGFSDEDFSNETGIIVNKASKLNFHSCNKSKHFKIKCKVIESCSGSDTESAFALPKSSVRKYRRKKARRMETEPELKLYRAENKETTRKKQCRSIGTDVKNMDLEISNDYVSSLKELDNCKSDEESDISTSEESNNEINGQVCYF